MNNFCFSFLCFSLSISILLYVLSNLTAILNHHVGIIINFISQASQIKLAPNFSSQPIPLFVKGIFCHVCRARSLGVLNSSPCFSEATMSPSPFYFLNLFQVHLLFFILIVHTLAVGHMRPCHHSACLLRLSANGFSHLLSCPSSTPFSVGS